MKNGIYRGIIGVVAVVLLAAVPSKADQLGLDIAADTTLSSAFGVGIAQDVGWSFTVTSSVTVDALGVFSISSAPATDSPRVGLWNNSGTLLAQTTITSPTMVASAATIGEWLFDGISPLSLTPGTYVLGAFYPSTSDSVIDGATISTASPISFDNATATVSSIFGEPIPNDLGGSLNGGVFGPNILIATTPTTTPEPSTIVLLGAGLLAFGVMAYCRRKAAPAAV